jgi:hypothetical protein
MKEHSFFKSFILLFGCFLALNLQMVQAQTTTSSTKSADMKPLCPIVAPKPGN